jgi:hypothetical protein
MPLQNSQNSANRATWWHDKEQKGRLLAEEIKALAARARAAGFQTTEYILDLAAAELWKDIEKENQSTKD